VNGKSLEDFLDWEFLTADEQSVLRARLPSGEEIEYDVERPEGLPMGVMLEPSRSRRCANHCDFCFVDGNPQGMRQALYIRDDDYRLSFRYGNFATLTNLKPWGLERIVAYRLSPLYVSVHATDPVVRRWLLRLAAGVPMPIRLSYDFADALADGTLEGWKVGMKTPSNRPTVSRRMSIPTVAIVGRPNVGKSTY
jgi:hypothetical protein